MKRISLESHTGFILHGNGINELKTMLTTSSQGLLIIRFANSRPLNDVSLAHCVLVNVIFHLYV